MHDTLTLDVLRFESTLVDTAYFAISPTQRPRVVFALNRMAGTPDVYDGIAYVELDVEPRFRFRAHVRVSRGWLTLLRDGEVLELVGAELGVHPAMHWLFGHVRGFRLEPRWTLAQVLDELTA
jgi:hypothetical protein